MYSPRLVTLYFYFYYHTIVDTGRRGDHDHTIVGHAEVRAVGPSDQAVDARDVSDSFESTLACAGSRPRRLRNPGRR